MGFCHCSDAVGRGGGLEHLHAGRNFLPSSSRRRLKKERRGERERERARKVFLRRLAINDASPIYLPRAFVLFSIVSPPLYLADSPLFTRLAFIPSFVSIPPPIFPSSLPETGADSIPRFRETSTSTQFPPPTPPPPPRPPTSR